MPDERKVAEQMRAMDLTTGPAQYVNGPLKWDERGRQVGAGLVIAQWRNGQPVAVFPPAQARHEAVWVGK
jgi:branched-chain amino acid transport system substrate-binding protein